MADHPALAAFHPATAAWFARTFAAPTPAQARAWPAIAAGRDTLVAAPTGSGKTLTAFLAAIDALVREALVAPLPDATLVVYVSPLKALSNDIHANLDAPLAGIRAELAVQGLPEIEIRTAVRTGDTPAAERGRMRKKPPHILVTTPESLYVLLGSESGRTMLGQARSVLVDEIHAVAASKRGTHLALSLERLDALCGQRLVRVGVSATQKPIDEVARFLAGASRVAADGTPDCAIVDIGYDRERDLALELPDEPLGTVATGGQWQQVYTRIATLARAHRTTLVFVNTRRMAERAARHLGELVGSDAVAAHHGSLSRELRLDAEQRLKRGALRVLVATASLELGIDIGDVDLVCQLGSPRSIAAFLQRVGRSGHHVGGMPKGRLFPATRDDLVECAALLDAVRRSELDALRMPHAPLDVLSQQIVAEVAMRDRDEDELFALARRAWPYRDLSRAAFDEVVRMLAEGFSTRRGPRAGLVHRDAVHRRLHARAGSRLTAVTSGGTIPDVGDYTVVLEPASTLIGSVNEDFAIESLAGDVFQLGNASYKILKIEPGRVRVEDAKGQPPNIPFWLGEAPGRTDELSSAVSRLRSEIAARVSKPLSHRGEVPRSRAIGSRGDERPAAERQGRGVGGGEGWDDEIGANRDDLGTLEGHRDDEHQGNTRPSPQPSPGGRGGNSKGNSGSDGNRESARAPDDCDTTPAIAWLQSNLGLDQNPATQLAEYVCRQHLALGVVPTQSHVVLERFFDASGGTQLVIHAPFGSRINRAWGLALRKRFCRTFNFELQAAATEDAIVLSLSTSHSFPLIDVAKFLHSASAEHVLVQALLDAPLFATRWRWNATTAMALARYTGGTKVAPQLQRMRSEDLLATVFPDQVACAENLVGEREVPEHPLVAQTLDDCLHEAMDAQGWLAVLRAMEAGSISVSARDTTGPSPFATEAINARPYAFLDDAPLEERRTQAVARRIDGELKATDDLGRLDVEAIDAVREEAWPQARNVHELHEALVGLGFITDAELQRDPAWPAFMAALAGDARATRLQVAPTHHVWVAAERLLQARALWPEAPMQPVIAARTDAHDTQWSEDSARIDLLRGRLTGAGPTTPAAIAHDFATTPATIDAALIALETDGIAMRGAFDVRLAGEQWCNRHLLARIHRYTLGRLRREIEPLSPQDFMRFLCEWQRVAPGARVRGSEALGGVLSQLEGVEVPAHAWEAEVLPARVADYQVGWLDELCSAGRIAWARLRASAPGGVSGRANTLRATPIVLVPRRQLPLWLRISAEPHRDAAPLSSRGQRVEGLLARHGATFFDDLQQDAHLLRTELEDALGELVARGRAHSDSFAGLRALLVPPSKRPSALSRNRRRQFSLGVADAGRWTLLRRDAEGKSEDEGAGPSRDVEAVATRARQAADDTEHVARALLRRYGVVCWRIVEREAAWLPPWRELLRVLHRLEARGEIRGGRFIAGLAGEQFALPDAVAALRAVRNRAGDGAWIALSAFDPLNLVGSVLPGARIPRQPGVRFVLRDGIALGTVAAGEFQLDASLDEADAQAARRALLHSAKESAFVV